MDFKQLEYFVRVAELGSFTRAANVLDIGQPALSRQVRQLEVELRQNLFVRNGRGVRTTEAGQILLEQGRGVLHQIQRIHEELSRVNGSLAGRVAIGLPPTVAQLVTVPLMKAFRLRLPHAVLAVSEGMTPSIIEGLVSGRLDVALLYNPTPSPEIDTQPLIEERLVLVGPRTVGARRDPITLADVSRLPLVMPGRLHTMRRMLEAEMAGISRKPNIACEVDGFPAILALVLEQTGYTVMPERVIQDSPHPRAFVTRPIVKPELISRLTIATSATRSSTLTQQEVIGLLREVAAATPGLNVVAPPGG
ncbi:MAG: LysR family transcriptional regulator [Lysobacteraceae bacterium]|nr:MAG: LysR family transcriptional regulator [Xanthomonadaceae bacterium]